MKLDVPNEAETRDKTFHLREVNAVFQLARSVRDTRYPKAAASRRWGAWICAYTGARIQEVCWLQKKDIWKEGEMWVIRFPKTKEQRARTVPIHNALLDEGFIDYWMTASEGLLFVGNKPQKRGAKLTQGELRASEIAAWIRAKVKLEEA